MCFILAHSCGICCLKVNFESSGGKHAWIIVFHILLILIVIYVFAPISGAHFNPAGKLATMWFCQRVNANQSFALINAVTLTTLLCRRVTIVRCVCYMIAQMAGAVAGAGMVRVAVPGALEDGLTVPHPLNTATQGQAFITEVKATPILELLLWICPLCKSFCG